MAQIDRLVSQIRFAATFADRAEVMQQLKALVGDKEAARLVWEG